MSLSLRSCTRCTRNNARLGMDWEKGGSEKITNNGFFFTFCGFFYLECNQHGSFCNPQMDSDHKVSGNRWEQGKLSAGERQWCFCLSLQRACFREGLGTCVLFLQLVYSSLNSFLISVWCVSNKMQWKIFLNGRKWYCMGIIIFGDNFFFCFKKISAMIPCNAESEGRKSDEISACSTTASLKSLWEMHMNMRTDER